MSESIRRRNNRLARESFLKLEEEVKILNLSQGNPLNSTEPLTNEEINAIERSLRFYGIRLSKEFAKCGSKLFRLEQKSGDILEIHRNQPCEGVTLVASYTGVLGLQELIHIHPGANNLQTMYDTLRIKKIKESLKSRQESILNANEIRCLYIHVLKAE